MTLRQLRLWSGLVLLAYLTSHFLNHALGLVSLGAMEAGREAFGWFWRGPGLPFLAGGLLVHAALAFVSIYLRRSFRLARWEWFQLGLGFAIPPLLAVHLIATLWASLIFGIEPTYEFVLFAAWVAGGWPTIQQSLLLFVAWLHGCIGLHFWLRLKPWYAQWQPYLYAVALVLPVLGFLGFASAGREVAILAEDPAWLTAMWARVGPLSDAEIAGIYALEKWVLGSYVALIAAVLTARAIRKWWHRRRSIRIDYPDGRSIEVRPGTSILEASRLAGIPHASVCGGRGRCSTCRVRVLAGAEQLPPASTSERIVLSRVIAGEGVRLACQVRPTAAVTVLPLLPAGASPRDAQPRPGYLQGKEIEIAILFADLRAFTALSEHKLPYDVVFILNRYFRAMGTAVETAGGHIDKFIGDGVMALFGIGENVSDGARRALEAARQMARNLEEVNRLLAHDLDEPLRIGIGIHAGAAIVGEMGYGRAISLTAVGDAVNTASRLETLTKEFSCQLVLSDAVAHAAGMAFADASRHELTLRGRANPLTVIAIENAALLPLPDAGQAVEPAPTAEAVLAEAKQAAAEPV
ncbi:MAG: adenylate/guanylate cyclase domain-containing protein [Dongiaceae bacterium]